MKYTSIKKTSLYIVLIITVVSIVSCIGIKSEVRHHSGLNTDAVNPLQFKTLSGKLAIRNISVLSSDSQIMQDSLTVLIDKQTIKHVGKNNVIPSDYQIIDGTGQYLIPGLVDTHTHLKKSKNDLLLFLANGVTHIANMNSWDQLYLKWRKEAENGALSPKIYIAAGAMNTSKGLIQKIRTLFGASKKYNTPSQGRKGVKEFKDQGYDAIKAYNLSKEVYFAVADEAKKQNIPMIGHLTPNVNLKDLYTSGQSQLAHIEEITKSTMKDFGGLNYDNTEEYLKYLRKNCDSIAFKLKKNNIVVSSTIWIIESFPKQKFNLENFIKEIKLEYANPGIIEGSKLSKGWLPNNNFYENLDIKNDPIKRKKSQLFWKTYTEAIHIMTKALIKNNVKIITGTDTNGACIVPGFSLHNELESLYKVGMTTTQVLHSATLAPAQWMKSNAGKIEAGYRADLVLLAKNPIEDIRNTKTINGVIANGKYLDRTTLDAILESIKKANNSSRKISIETYIK